MRQIDVKNLSFGYGRNPVLEKISLEVEQGDFLAIIGPNGGGKSTFLKLILGLLQPGSGSISVLGKAPSHASAQVGYVPQNLDFNRGFPINVLDVVLMGLLDRKNIFFGYTKAEIARARAMLSRVHMEPFAARRIDDLSGGQMQRVLMARALIAEPEILILDEPTSNIDSQGEHEIYEILRSLNETMTVIVVSHDISFLLDYAKRILFINKTMTLHNAPAISKEKLIRSLDIKDNHLCEVELLNFLSCGGHHA